MIFAQQLFHKNRDKRQYIDEDKRITNELLDLWHEASSNSANSNSLYSDPQWNDEWYLVRILSKKMRNSVSI